ncbi:MAG: OsmC family protein [Candidatus Krumholzibacteriota bacterium]|nr:OsmC family protein [Candidatus Krumholzibacteriota bacterium]
MSKQTVDLNWTENMSFSTTLDGHEIVLDAGSGSGGEDRGPRPKQLMLVALAGCTGMDVVSILKKMKVEIEGFRVLVEGELTDEHPKYYRAMHVIYEFRGDGLPMDKLEKAVSLSEEKYCGVSALYKKAIEVSSEIRIAG